MMLTLLAYSYAVGELLAGERAPLPRGRRLPRDHSEPVPRPRDDRSLRVRHEQALADLFGQLGLCADAGLVEVGVLAVDGTKRGVGLKSREPKLRANREGDPRRGGAHRPSRGRAPR